MTKKLTDILKEQPITVIQALECKLPNCKYYEPYPNSISSYCKYDFTYMKNDKGKGKIFQLCYLSAQTLKKQSLTI